MDGVLQLDNTEKELVHESFVVDTRDHEDHTFCGIMFNAECATTLPAEYIEISSVWVRGQLGPMTVWHTPDSFNGKLEEEGEWKKMYSATHAPNQHEYTELKLDESIRLRPGERCGLYVHSGLPGDEGLVYDNQRQHVTYQDRVLKVYPGYAHLSNRPFGARGFWGRPWRSNREFVGRMEYGVRWKMWQPNDVHRSFPVGFQKTAMTMIMASRRTESLMYLLQVIQTGLCRLSAGYRAGPSFSYCLPFTPPPPLVLVPFFAPAAPLLWLTWLSLLARPDAPCADPTLPALTRRCFAPPAATPAATHAAGRDRVVHHEQVLMGLVGQRDAGGSGRAPGGLLLLVRR